MSKPEAAVGPEKSGAPKKEIAKVHGEKVSASSSSVPDKPLDWKDRERDTLPTKWRQIPEGKGPIGVLWPPKYQLRNHLDDLEYCRKMLELYGSLGAPAEFKRGQKLYHGGSTDAIEHPEKGKWFYLTLDKRTAEYYAGRLGYSDPSHEGAFVSEVGTAPGVSCYRYSGDYDADFLVCRWDDLAGLYGWDVDLGKYKKWDDIDDDLINMEAAMKTAEFASENLIEALGYDGRVSEEDAELGLPPRNFSWLEKIDCDTAPDFYDSEDEQESQGSQSGGDDDDDDNDDDDDDDDDQRSIEGRISDDSRASCWLSHTKVLQ